MAVDRTDAKILNLVQQDNRMTTERIGEIVGKSPTAVVRRLKRLRDDGVIEADVALVSEKAVGFSVEFFVLCTLERDSPEAISRFMDALRAEPRVTSALMVAGETDFVFTVVARDMEEYQSLHQHYRDEFPGVTSITSLAVLERVKRGRVVLVESDSPEMDEV